MTMTNRYAGRSLIRSLLLPAFALVAVGTGCVQLAALWTNITGGDVVESEYTLTKSPLLILIDDRNSIVSEPAALREVHRTISDLFLQYHVNSLVVPFQDWRRLQQTAKDYDRLSIRQIGEKLGAEQVLYLRVDRFTLHAEPGAPIFKGAFTVRVSVLSTLRQHDVRLWPRAEGGRSVSVRTRAASSDGNTSSADVARELAGKLGKKVARLFYQHREFEE